MDDSNVVDLCRRIQRIELLLFRTPTPLFEKFDAHISNILHEDSLVRSEEALAPLSIPETCEVFALSDDAFLASEDGDSWLDDTGDIVESFDCTADSELHGNRFEKQFDTLRDDIESLNASFEKRLANIANSLASLGSAGFVTLPEVCSNLAVDFLPTLVQIVDAKIDKHETRLTALDTTAVALDGRISIILRMMEKLTEQLGMLRCQAEAQSEEVNLLFLFMRRTSFGVSNYRPCLF